MDCFCYIPEYLHKLMNVFDFSPKRVRSSRDTCEINGYSVIHFKMCNVRNEHCV